MRVLIVSNLFPPYYKGGYEIRCAQVAGALQRAGHDVRVLTSTFGLPVKFHGRARGRTEEAHGVRIHRWLNQYAFEPQPKWRPWTVWRTTRELSDARRFLDVMRGFQPDVVNWWSMYGLSKLLLPLPASFRIPDVHWIEHWWMIEDYGPNGERPREFWKGVWEGRWGPRLIRPITRRLTERWEARVGQQGIPTREFPNRPSHVCFVSEYKRDLYERNGFAFASSEVIHGGIPVSQFYAAVRDFRLSRRPIRLLYAGQISPDRGLHTIIQGLELLNAELRSAVTLSVAGDGDPQYLAVVRRQVMEAGLRSRVTFLGMVPHEHMSQLYKLHDILVFSSMRDEGFPLTMIEAMLAGCLVLTTESGGAREVAKAACLQVFEKGDAVSFCQTLEQCLKDRERTTEWATRSQRIALQEFNADRMMERFIRTLERVGEGAGRCGP